MASAAIRRLPVIVSALALTTSDASLARLPKASNYAAIQFRDATPGSKIAISQAFQRTNPSGSISKNSNNYFLDSSHPFHRCHPSEVPRYTSDVLELTAWPFARLRPHSASATPNPYSERPRRKLKDGQVTMSVALLVPVALHTSGCIRSIIRARVREALKLVVVRGACSSEVKDRKGSRAIVELSEDDADPERWITKGWTYIFRPRLPVYKSPMPELVDEVRDALATVKIMTETLEDRWFADTETSSKAIPNHFIKASHRPISSNHRY
ncbi:hypothetical protein FRB94_006396 [Tulasnella sp. JGI-2019a]|nr:hypothetical protein FRB94_006396 [Tulasnella sp. JGI-2019a]KAG9005064.1 hypothetical protein FRB93_009933 [Tulasnella sp. JGI-2019a]KAG9037906.1 hypothetical protein FRB95_003746 [Tulasnella sp. JGI-2019a]